MKDNRVALRFYKVTGKKPGAIELESLLRHLVAKSIPDRERDLLADDPDNSFIARLERLDDVDPYIQGEFVRRQMDNKPPAADATGLKPIVLAPGAGIGHSIAFVYHPGTQVLALEINRNLLVSRVFSYLYLCDALADYRIEPLVTETAWQEFETARPKKFRLRIADPKNLNAIETDEALPVVESLKRLANATDAPYITIEASMGSRKGQLDRGMVRRLLNLFGKEGDKDADVRALSVDLTTDGVEGTQTINFLEQILSAEATLPLKDDNPDLNYKTRAAWIKGTFSSQLPYIISVYGNADGG